MTLRRALLALLLLSPLAELPGTGFDVLRLPLALALAAVFFASGPPSAPGTAGRALLAFLAVQALSLFATPDLPAGLAAVLTTAVAAAAYAAARDVRSGTEVPRVLTVVAVVLLAAAVLQRTRGLAAASLLGNPNYTGGLAAMLLPALAGMSRHRIAWLGLAASSILLALSESRGGLLGAAAGTAAAALALWRSGRRGSAVAAAVALLAAPLVGLLAKPEAYLSAARLRTADVRLDVWARAVRMAAERPLLGAGAGGFGATYPPYRGETEARITQADAGRSFREVEDAHSSWVQAFSESGVPGALAWLLLAAVALRLALRAGAEGAGWTGAAVAFLAAGLFNTLSAHASHAVLFGAALGFLEARGPSPWPRPAAWAAAAALGLGAVWSAVRIGPDLAYHRAISSPDPAERLARARDAGGWRGSYQRGVELDRQGRHREAAEAYRAALERRPAHGASLNNLAIALLRSGAPRAEAEEVLLRAQERAPHYYLTHFNLGQLRLEEGRFEEARARFERAAWLNETHGPSRYEIGATFLAEGDVPGALPHLRRARELGVDVGAALRRDRPAAAADPRLAEFGR